MKLVKLSLCAMLALSTSVVAEDSLVDAFQNGTFKGELKSYYFDRETGNGASDANILNFALDMHYVTGDFYGFKAGATVQTSSAPFADEEAKDVFSAKNDMYGSGAVLSQAYLAYSLNNTTIKVGRQYVRMPLLAGSGSRIVMQSFQGATLVSNAIANTKLSAGYITKSQNRTDGNGNIADFEELGTDVDYGYVVAIENTSIPKLKLTAAYGELDNSYSMYLGEAKFTNKLEKAHYNLAVQYVGTDYDAATAEDSSFYGIKLGGGLSGFNAYVAYAEVQDATSKFGVVGGGNKPMIYTTTVIDAGQYAESEQYAIDANYMIKSLGLMIGTRFINVDYATNTEADFTDLYASYKFKGVLKGLTTSVQYEVKDADVESTEFKELRFRAIYKF